MAGLGAIAPSFGTPGTSASDLLVHAVLDTCLRTHLFATCCKALHACACGRCGHGHEPVCAVARIISHAIDNPPATWPTVVRTAIGALESQMANWLMIHETPRTRERQQRVGGRRPSEEDLALEAGVSAAHLSHAIHTATCLHFREWRRALVMRPALRQLAETDEQVAQLGYRAGYDWPPQFTREFRELLGLTPTEFRRLWRSLPGSKSVDAQVLFRVCKYCSASRVAVGPASSMITVAAAER